MSSVRKNPRIYSREELRAQEAVIVKILETGTQEELRLLEQAENDPDLHPQIRCLIDECRGRVGCSTSLQEDRYTLSPELFKERSM
ncbi:MAG: hypothetical protein ABIH78_04090 [Candidatus Peregrinibacteria bacterium]